MSYTHANIRLSLAILLDRDERSTVTKSPPVHVRHDEVNIALLHVKSLSDVARSLCSVYCVSRGVLEESDENNAVHIRAVYPQIRAILLCRRCLVFTCSPDRLQSFVRLVRGQCKTVSTQYMY